MDYFTLLFMTPAGDGNPGSGFATMIIWGAIFVVFYLFLIRPQSKRQKEVQNKVAAMKKGDKVVTSSGIIGILNAIDEDTVLVEVGNNVKIRILTNAITDVNPNKPEKK